MSSRSLPDFSESVDVEANKNNVIDSLGLVQRQGIDDLINYLETSNYFHSPASTKYHNVFEGGLCQHSLNVTREFSRENSKWQKPLPQDSVIICGLCHDLCKTGVYIETHNGYEKAKDAPKGHAKLSISRVTEYIELTPVENSIILFHMGLFGAYLDHEFTPYDIYKAIAANPIVQVFAAIDQADARRKRGI
jgi:hypothetical protein